MEALDAFIGTFFAGDNWPFWAIAVIFAVIGNVAAQRVFTRPRAYTKGFWQPLWWWMRETLPLQPIVAGAAVGFFWRNPKGVVWELPQAMAYFAFAGTVSLFLWVVIKGVAKKKGVELTLPGDSEPPAAAP